MSHAEKDFYRLTVSVNKALNGIEAPLKTKHARSVIIIICKAKEAKSFWMIISRQPLMEMRFTAWKFCHLLHKVLRESHESSIKHSLAHRKMILEVGKLWGHLQDDIGFCIKAYTKLLVTKLNFHEKNRICPGSLNTSLAEIAKFADDNNYYFQLCVEIFDYLEDIIAVQQAIFSTINTYRMSSMTQQGQCRLAPLVCLIQDSNPLYDICVRLMFKLHEALPNDVLSGHRERFHGLFRKLKEFYENVRPLQYFKDLITVPDLPESSPNFRSQVDFGSYVPPVVFVPEPEPDPVVEDLVDTNNSAEEEYNQTHRVNELESIIREKDAAIEELRQKLNEFQQHFIEMKQSYNHHIAELQENNTTLSNELAVSKEMCANIRMQNDDLELQLTNGPLLIQKATEEEEKHKLSSEKFNKLKTMYTQIRDEHIKLLREHSDSSKALNKEKQVNSEMLLQMNDLNNDITQLKESIEAKNKTNFTLLQQIEDHKDQNLQLEVAKNEIKENYESLLKENDIQNLSLQSTSKNLEEHHLELEVLKSSLKEVKEQLVQAEGLIVSKDNELLEKHKSYEDERKLLLTKNEQLEVAKNEIKENFESLLKESDLQKVNLKSTSKNLEENHVELEILKTNLKEAKEQLVKAEGLVVLKDNELVQNQKSYEGEHKLLITKNEQLVLESKQKYDDIFTLLKETENKLQVKETACQHSEETIATLRQENLLMKQSLAELQHNQKLTEEKLGQTLLNVDSLTSSKKLCESTLSELKTLIIHTVEEICNSKLNVPAGEPLEAAPKTKLEMETLLEQFKHTPDTRNGISTTRLKDVMYLGYVFVKLYDQCDIIYKSTTEIEKGQDILNKIRSIGFDLCQLFKFIKNEDANENAKQAVLHDMKIKLTDLIKLVQEILDTYENKIDFDKLVEMELQEMDAAIEDAASKITDLLAKAREKDNKINLDVNGKILDACTTLMECIKVLILKSRVLQQEIVSSQKGNATVNEFYRRNTQWSDGLISASKSVAKAANFLVDAANNAIESESGKNFELIVAAQEIAACTAQLVIASKVKANRDSVNLNDLTKASRNVTKATGTVVATVKDSNSQLEQLNVVDLCKLTPSQIKTMEMEIHVKVLETEQALQTQRLKLSAFRREHYKNTEY